MREEHASAKLPLAKAKRMARKIVEHHFGTKPMRLTHETAGLTNLVFSVRHPDGDLVVRISPHQEKLHSFMKEQWAMVKVREVGVPTPEVLEVANQAAPVPYMVSRRSKGKPATDHPDRQRILEELGRYAAVIHTVETIGFGGTFDWSHNRLSHNATWEEFLTSELKLEERLSVLQENGMAGPAEVKLIRKTLQGACASGRKPALTHSDLRLKNVLVNEQGRISSILDWENCMSNLATEWELSVALHDLSIDAKESFVKGYGMSAEAQSAAAPVMKALNLVNYAPKVARLAKQNDAEGLERYRGRLRGELDLYSLCRA